MTGKKYSIIIIPSAGGKSLQFSFSSLWLYGIATLLLTVFAINAFFTYGFFAKSYQQQTVAGLIDENEFLVNRVSYFSSEIENLKEDYSFMVDKEKEIRTIFDLPQIPRRERSVSADLSSHRRRLPARQDRQPLKPKTGWMSWSGSPPLKQNNTIRFITPL
jgi:hypothetical protein